MKSSQDAFRQGREQGDDDRDEPHLLLLHKIMRHAQVGEAQGPDSTVPRKVHKSGESPAFFIIWTPVSFLVSLLGINMLC